MSPQRDYEYPGLDTTQKQIRLLRLRHRARHGHLPQYELHTFDLKTAPNYIALSYTWGKEPPTLPIRVNRKKLYIRPNLHAFLEGVAMRQYIWIDQICIDQSNPAERNHQVRMMAQIYKDCDSMIIWLGSQDQRFKEAADEFIYKPRRESLLELLRDYYWTRLWVVQEVLLARAVQIYCHGMRGVLKIPWNEVHAVATGCSLWLRQHGGSKEVLALIANQGMNHYQGLRLTIARFSGYNCEDPRDKVYGLLGIVKEKERLEPDYNKPVQEVFLDVARALRDSKMSRPDSMSCRARLKSLADKMDLGSEDKDLTGLRAMLQDVFTTSNSPRSDLAKLPKTAQVKNFGFDPARSGAGLTDDKAKRRLARWWCEYEGKKYYHACCVCDSAHMCRCNPGKAIIRKTLKFPFVAAGVQLTAKQKQALNGTASKGDSAKTTMPGADAPAEEEEEEEGEEEGEEEAEEEWEKWEEEEEEEEKGEEAKSDMRIADVGLWMAEQERFAWTEPIDEDAMEDSEAPAVRLPRIDSLAVEVGS